MSVFATFFIRKGSEPVPDLGGRWLELIETRYWVFVVDRRQHRRGALSGQLLHRDRRRRCQDNRVLR